jgi:copper resistance protein B
MRLARTLVLVGLMAVPRLHAWGQAMPGMTPNSSTMDLDRQIRVFGLADLLEYVPNGTGAVRVDALGWIGGDYNRLYFQLDGEQPFKGVGGQTAVDVTYGRLLTPFWTGLVGGRLEVRGLGSSQRSTRGLLAVGLEGLSPYFFQVEPTLYVSRKGQVSGRFTTSMDLLFTQRLILQPRVETNFAVQGVPELDIGAGVNDVELGARMRYEVRREFAPYLGLVWSRQTGATAGFARSAGEPAARAGIVFGLRMWR